MRKKNSGPFLRGLVGVYYCWIDGHLKSLRTKKPKIAEGRYRELLMDWEAQKNHALKPDPWTVRQCLDYYLEFAKAMKPNSYRNRKQTFDRFCEEAKVGALPWDSLTADHIEAWSKLHGWSPSMRRSSMNYITTAFRHCHDRGKIATNPIKGIQKPRWQRRKAVMASADLEAVFAAAAGPFRDFLAVQIATGARPGELCSARVEHYRAGVITLLDHKEDESGEDRVIYLTASAAAVAERRIAGRAAGHIFLNSRGEPWTSDTLYCRFKRLRRKLGLGEGVFPYGVRTRFASDTINSGNANAALIAKQLGHTDLTMLLKHYLREDPEAVRKALDEATKKPG
jgi:integrase/recombinase XerC